MPKPRYIIKPKPYWQSLPAEHLAEGAVWGVLYGPLNAAYTATGEWPAVGREGAFPFALVEAQKPRIAEVFTALWNEYMAMQLDVFKGGPRPAKSAMDRLEARIIAGLTYQIDTFTQSCASLPHGTTQATAEDRERTP